MSKRAAIEEFILVGNQMSNRLYNMRQNEHRMPDVRDRDEVDALIHQWDYALQQYRQVTKKKARPA